MAAYTVNTTREAYRPQAPTAAQYIAERTAELLRTGSTRAHIYTAPEIAARYQAQTGNPAQLHHDGTGTHQIIKA